MRHPLPRLERRELGAIFLGGGAGTLARAGLATLPAGAAPGWPWVTFAVNVAGCLLLGYLTTRLQERLPLSLYRRPLLGTGFCGALTTFSTFQVELLEMVEHHRWATAAGYAAASIGAGLAGMLLATALTRRVRTVL